MARTAGIAPSCVFAPTRTPWNRPTRSNRYLGDRLAARAEAGAALSHTLPSAALTEGKTGESMADEFIAKGVGACTIADRPVDGLLFIPASLLGLNAPHSSARCG
ncbi:hypothetical protein [Allochromatium tepidum]